MKIPLPEIGANEVLAEIHAASIYSVDFKVREGRVKILVKQKVPLILGNDFGLVF